VPDGVVVGDVHISVMPQNKHQHAQR
jgi:hypothetical protein